MQEQLRSLESQICSLCRNGELGTALPLLSHVPTALTDGTYKVLLEACLKKKSLPQAKQVHAHLSYHRPSFCSWLREQLVLTFAKCGALEDACDILHACTRRTVLSWTAIISGFVESGRPQEAFRLFKCMEEDNVEPNHYTFVALLKACGSALDINKGRKLHEEVRKLGLLSNIHVCNTLVSMYGKCGSIFEAEDVFKNGGAQLDLVSWNAMLSAYVELEKGYSALRLLRQMQEEGVSPDGRTFIMALLACNHNKEQAEVLKEEFSGVFSAEVGESLHADAKKLGFDSNDFFISTLVSMYGRCKSIPRAENVFCSINYPDIVQWNAMLTAYSEVGQVINVLQIIVHLNKEGISPDQHTYVISLQACCVLAEEEGILTSKFASTKSLALEIGEALHVDAWKRGYASNAFINTSLISLYSKCRVMEKAEIIFQQIDKRRAASWNAMLSAYVERSEGEKALQLYSSMQKNDVIPDAVTLVVAIQACCLVAGREIAGDSTCSISLEIGKGLHTDAQRDELHTNELVANTLIHMYGKCGVIYNGEEVFAGLSQCSVVSWNAMLSAFVEQGLGDKTSHLFWQMQEKGILMNETTFISALKASGMTGWAEVCKKVHFILVTEGYDVYSLLITTLIHAYGTCALLADAQAVFRQISQYDVVSCSAYLDALVQNGKLKACLEAFSFMQWAGLEPDGITFYSLLSGCSHAGIVDVGVECFDIMIKHCCILPEFRHYAIMLDLLGRAGSFSRLQKLLVTIQPTIGIWSSLLGVCRLHGNVEIGKWAFDHIVRLRPKEASAYVLMWNIFAGAGMQDCADQIDLLRQRQGLEKVFLDCDEFCELWTT